MDETLSHLIFAFESDFIPEALYKDLENEGEEIDRMLNGYIGYLKKSKQGLNEPGANISIQEETAAYDVESLEDSNNSDESSTL